jgi:hypothetical protein
VIVMPASFCASKSEGERENRVAVRSATPTKDAEAERLTERGKSGTCDGRVRVAVSRHLGEQFDVMRRDHAGSPCRLSKVHDTGLTSSDRKCMQ